MAELKPTPFDKITIRVISIGQDQKTKFVFPAIANNKQLMKNVGFVISDPQYDAKMEAIRNKKPFSENGVTKLPAQESFAPKVEPEIKQAPVEQPKSEAFQSVTTDEIKGNDPAGNVIESPAIQGEPKTKRLRRTKAQIEADKLTASKTAETA